VEAQALAEYRATITRHYSEKAARHLLPEGVYEPTPTRDHEWLWATAIQQYLWSSSQLLGDIDLAKWQHGLPRKDLTEMLAFFLQHQTVQAKRSEFFTPGEILDETLYSSLLEVLSDSECFRNVVVGNEVTGMVTKCTQYPPPKLVMIPAGEAPPEEGLRSLCSLPVFPARKHQSAAQHDSRVH